MLPYRADVMLKRWPVTNWVIMGLTIAVSIAAMLQRGGQGREKFSLWRRDALAHARSQFPGVPVRYAGEDDEADSPEKEAPAQTAEDAAVSTEEAEAPDLTDDEKLAEAFKALAEAADLKIEVHRFHPYQLVSHSLLHIGFVHLFGNMIFLWVFGNAVNAKVGHAAYAGLYIVFAIVSGVAWYVMPGEGWMMLGASGAVMGVAGMFAVLYPLNEISVFYMLFFHPRFFSVSAVWILLLYFTLDVLGFLSSGGVVANISHIVGMLTGVAVTSLLVLSALIRPGRGERTLLEVLGIRVKREGGRPYHEPIRSTVVIPTPPQMREAARGEKPRPVPAGETPPARQRVRRGPGELPPIELTPLSFDEDGAASTDRGQPSGNDEPRRIDIEPDQPGE